MPITGFTVTVMGRSTVFICVPSSLAVTKRMDVVDTPIGAWLLIAKRTTAVLEVHDNRFASSQ